MGEKEVFQYQFGSLKVSLLQCLQDNYVFVLQSSLGTSCVVVDPTESLLVDDFLIEQDASVEEIWITHHHHDHIGGVASLKEKYRCAVRGAQIVPGRLADVTQPIAEGASWSWAEYQVTVLALPGHTLDHMAYWLRSAEHSLLFSGDVLFGAGCGRVFEGTYEQMLESLQKIAQLPEHTQVFCSHEYTQKNLEFSLSVLPNDRLLKARASQVEALRAQGKPTVPLLLSEEKQTNLFLRTLRFQNAITEFTKLRDWRNRY